MIRYMVVFAITLLLTGCTWVGSKTKEDDLMRVKSEAGNETKKVILLVADSLMYQAIDQEMKNHKLPAFKYLIEHGRYYKDIVSSFPTMSVTIDSSLLTGTYPDQHHVPGLAWYSSDERRVVNYGTGLSEIWKQGIHSVLKDLLVNINGSHLNPQIPTIFEQLAQSGFTSASINGMIYRGKTEHMLKLPLWAQAPASQDGKIKVKGPDFFAFGALSNPLHRIRNLPDGPTNKMGFNNEYALETVKHLITNNRLPDFVSVYLPDMDQPSHRKGPSYTEGVQILDRQLQSLFQAFGSADAALKKVILIVIGDSGVSQLLPADQEPVIELPSLFNGYNVLRPGAAVTEKTELVLAVNETMAYVYKMKSGPSLRQLADLTKSEARIDLTAWKENGWMHVTRNGIPGELRFKANGPIKDMYGQSWALDHNRDVLDLKISGDKLEYGQYPDALARLSGALNSHRGPFLVITAKPGYELAAQSSPTHEGGGGHGSLHAEESLIPLIICGTDRDPQRHRLVDIKNYVMQLLMERQNLR